MPAPVAVRAILRTIRETEGLPENDAFAVEARIGMAVFASEDAKEGPRAFAEKRKPVFRDRQSASWAAARLRALYRLHLGGYDSRQRSCCVL